MKDKNQAKKSSKSTKITPANKEIITKDDVFVLETWKLFDENPFYRDLPKPDVEYIFYFLKHQPELRSIAHLQRRESLMNACILGWLRDRLFSKVSKLITKHPEDWEDYVEPKMIRLFTKIIEVQEEILPRLLSETYEGMSEKDITKKIKGSLIIKTIDVEIDSEPNKPDENVIDAEYKVVDE